MITKTEQETGFVLPFYKCNVTYTLTQAANKDEFSMEVTETQKLLKQHFCKLSRGSQGGGGGLIK